MTSPAKFAVAIAVLREGRDGWEAVLVARKDDHTQWSLPGGKVDPGEDSQQAACRELEEETGIRASRNAMIPQGTHLGPSGYLTTFYLLDTTWIPLRTEFKEIPENEAPIRWGPIEDLLTGPFGPENQERFERLGLLT